MGIFFNVFVLQHFGEIGLHLCFSFANYAVLVMLYDVADVLFGVTVVRRIQGGLTYKKLIALWS